MKTIWEDIFYRINFCGHYLTNFVIHDLISNYI